MGTSSGAYELNHECTMRLIIQAIADNII